MTTLHIIIIIILNLLLVKQSVYSFQLATNKILVHPNIGTAFVHQDVRSSVVNSIHHTTIRIAKTTLTATTTCAKLSRFMISKRSQILEPHHANEIINESLTLTTHDDDNDDDDNDNDKNDNDKYKHIFHQFVHCICSASCIPRKELYEAWSTALIIHKHYPNQRRLADLACGHGLLSWSLLLLSMQDRDDKVKNNKEEYTRYTNDNMNIDDNKNNSHIIRTAVCIDKRMPQSAEKIASVMIQRWPELEGKWHYVEGKLEHIIPSSSTLLCGIHACGILTDYIISLALDCNAPLALIPCCHSKKSLRYMGSSVSSSSISSSLSEYIDKLRIERLSSSNYTVTKEQIPEEYTPQNKMIIASPPPLPTAATVSIATTATAATATNTLKTSTVSSTLLQSNKNMIISGKQKRKRRQQPLMYRIPIGDDEKSIKIVQSLSGRKAANERKEPNPPSLCVSMFMPEESTINPDILHSLVNKVWHLDSGRSSSSISNSSSGNFQVSIEYSDDGPFLHPNGCYARTFSVTYEKESSQRIDKKRAKELHDELCTKIPSLMDGIRIRR